MGSRATELALTVTLVLTTGCSAAEPDAPPPRASPTPLAEPAEPVPRILRLVLRSTPSGIETVSAREARGRVNRRDPHAASPTFFRALDRDGRVLVERGFTVATEIRSETAGDDGRLRAIHLPRAEPLFTVAVPLVPELHSIRFYRAAPGTPREQATALGEIRP